MTNAKSSTPAGDPPEPVRDARLAQALLHMPDAHMQASHVTRQAVLRAAQAAVHPAPPAAPARWWTRLWGAAAPGPKIPWTTALASVLIASFVGVLWHDQEVPGPIPQGPAPTPHLAEATAPTPSISSDSMQRPEPPAAQAKAKPGPARPQAPAAPAPPAAVVAPAMVLAAPAASPQSKVADRADAGGLETLRITGSARKRQANAAPPEKLLQALRDLACVPPVPDGAPQRLESEWVIESPQGDVWSITPHSLAWRNAASATTRFCTISADQYEQLRQLAR